MPLSGAAVQQLYTTKIGHYRAFVRAFHTPQGIKALLRRSPLLCAGIRVLDAGCGFGMVTFALLEVLRERSMEYTAIDAFDLTPAMLASFQCELEKCAISRVQLRQADVLALDTLPSSWTGYDLIISASMLEYLPRQDLPRALAGLHARLAPAGHILVVITRKTPETKVFIEWLWHAERYAKHELLRRFAEAGFRDPVFRRFPWPYFWLNRANYIIEATA
jgi:SAM-dependent methyltransferase